MNRTGATGEPTQTAYPIPDSQWLSDLAAGFVIVVLAAFCLVVFLSWGGGALGLTVATSTILAALLLSAVLALSDRLRFPWPKPTTSLLLMVLGMGTVLRAAFAIWLHPEPFSDFAAYDWSARHLLSTGEYVCREGEHMLRAYRPPGTAFLLAAALWATGGCVWSALILNCVCYVATVVLLWRAAFFAYPPMAPAITISYALWPSDILISALPQSESPSLVVAAGLIYLLVRPMPISWRVIAFSFAVGLSCLIRNSNLVMVAVSALVIIQQSLPLVRRAALLALAVVCTCAPIALWTARNYKLLGVPVLVANNGGENLYSANNPNADGSWEPTSVAKVRAYLPDEVKMDKVAFALAKDWIAQHPVAFGKLALRKIRSLLSSDDWGAYYAMERGAGYTGLWYSIAKLMSNLWWIGVWASVLLTVRTRLGLLWNDSRLIAIGSLTVGPALLFLIFQSQPRYHAFMIPGLLWIAAQRMRPNLVDER